MKNYLTYYKPYTCTIQIVILLLASISPSTPAPSSVTTKPVKKNQEASSKRKPTKRYLVIGSMILTGLSVCYIISGKQSTTDLTSTPLPNQPHENPTNNTTNLIRNQDEAKLLCAHIMRDAINNVVDDMVDLIASFVLCSKYRMTSFIIEGTSKASIDADERYAIDIKTGGKTDLVYHQDIGRYVLTTDKQTAWKVFQRWAYQHTKYPMFFQTNPIPTDSYRQELEEKAQADANIRGGSDSGLLSWGQTFPGAYYDGQYYDSVIRFTMTPPTNLSKEELNSLRLGKVWKAKEMLLNDKAFNFVDYHNNTWDIQYCEKSLLEPITKLWDSHPASPYHQLVSTRIIAVV